MIRSNPASPLVSTRYLLPIRILLTALIWGLAYYELGSLVGAVLGLAAAVTIGDRHIIAAFRLSTVWVLFAVAHFVGFAWFAPALALYSRWESLAVGATFIVFALYGALQFVAFVWITQRLSRTSLRSYSLDIPLAWCAVELCFFRPFDWSLAHTLTATPVFIQLADIGGAPLVSCLIVWIACLAADSLRNAGGSQRWQRSGVLALLLFVVGYGLARQAQLKDRPSLARVLVVNANTAPTHEFSPHQARVDWRSYITLTKARLDPSVDFVVWPESAILELVFDLPAEEQRAILESEGMTFQVPVLFGSQRTLADLRVGNIVGMLEGNEGLEHYYVKGVPFPLAEGDLFARFRPQSGEGQQVLTVAMAERAPLEVLPLVCFESTVANVVRGRARAHAPDLLIEFSNLNWFGNTIAPAQHEVLAVWRALEHRKPLLRVVNAAPSALVTANGSIIGVPSAGVGSSAVVEIPQGQVEPTLYVRFAGVLYCLLLAVTAAFLLQHYVGKMLRRCELRYLILAGMLILLGGLFSVGTFFSRPMLQRLGLIGGFSPNPFVFNKFEGLHYWAHQIEIDILHPDLTRSTHRVDSTLFSKLPGPHHYHMAFAVPFAFAPLYEREYWEAPLQKGFCGAGDSRAVLAEALALVKPVASVRVRIQEKVPHTAGADPRSWSMRIACGGSK